MARRALTPGERRLVKDMFGLAVQLDPVRLVRGRWMPFQPRNVAMAPMGNIHFHPAGNLWSDDFSADALWRQALFLHEMTHVWQSQQRGRWYLPLMRHPFCRYGYAIVPGRRFEAYGLEQQAEIVRHAFLLRHGRSFPGAPPLAQLESILPFGR